MLRCAALCCAVLCCAVLCCGAAKSASCSLTTQACTPPVHLRSQLLDTNSDSWLLECRKQKMLRCVVREDLSFEMASDLVDDMKKCIEWLDHHFIYSGV